MIFLSDGDDLCKQLMLAQITAIPGIMAKPFDIQFFAVNNDMADALLSAEFFRFFQFPDRKRTGTGRDSNDLISQHIVGYL